LIGHLALKHHCAPVSMYSSGQMILRRLLSSSLRQISGGLKHIEWSSSQKARSTLHLPLLCLPFCSGLIDIDIVSVSSGLSLVTCSTEWESARRAGPKSPVLISWSLYFLFYSMDNNTLQGFSPHEAFMFALNHPDSWLQVRSLRYMLS